MSEEDVEEYITNRMSGFVKILCIKHQQPVLTSHVNYLAKDKDNDINVLTSGGKTTSKAYLKISSL